MIFDLDIMDKELQDKINRCILMHTLHINESSPNRKVLYGAGFFSSLKDLGIKAYKTVKDIFPKVTKELFQHAANAYRKLYGNEDTRPLYPGEFHYGLHNFTGPGTRIDLPNVRNATPYNDIDEASKVHDIEYYEAKKLPINKRAEAIHKADQKAIDAYNRYPREDGYKEALLGIAGKSFIDQLYSVVKGKPSTFYGGKERRKEKIK